MLAWSLFVFVQLGFGQWLTADYGATVQMFTYFAGTLVALHFVMNSSATGAFATDRQPAAQGSAAGGLGA
jgi:hypothetical protein